MEPTADGRAVRGFLDFLFTRRFGRIFAPGIPITGLVLGFSPYGKTFSASLKAIGTEATFYSTGARPHRHPFRSQRNIEALAGPTTVVWQPHMGHAEGDGSSRRNTTPRF